MTAMLTLPHASLEVPVLETNRLRLRAQCLEDFPACAAMWADNRVTRHTTGHALSEEETWSRFLRGLGHWAILGFGYWAVEEKSGGQYIGEMGFADLKRDIQPSLQGLPEMGWIFSPRVHGQGYATEAVRAALAWGKTRFGTNRPVCIVSPGNVASIRVAEKCGFQEFTRTTYRGDPVILFRNNEK
jgi:RimJ/RimL family protein N-acetyltransferase